MVKNHVHVHGVYISFLVGTEVTATSTESGCTNTFKADAVVVTVPLGVLKAGAITFQPPLPEWKQQAINDLGFGLLNKVCCFYLFIYLFVCLFIYFLRLYYALSKGFGMLMFTCLVMLPPVLALGENSSCSGT